MTGAATWLGHATVLIEIALQLVTRQRLAAPAADFARHMAEREPGIRAVVAPQGERITFG